MNPPPEAVEAVREMVRTVEAPGFKEKLLLGQDITKAPAHALLFWDRGIIELCCDRLTALGVIDTAARRAAIIAAVEGELSSGRLARVSGMAALLAHTGDRARVFELVMLRAVLHWIAVECLRREATSPAGSQVVQGTDDEAVYLRFGEELAAAEKEKQKSIPSRWRDPEGDWRQRAILGVLEDLARTKEEAAGRVDGFAASVAPEPVAREALAQDLRETLSELLPAIGIRKGKGRNAVREEERRSWAEQRGGGVRPAPLDPDTLDHPERASVTMESPPERPDERMIREASAGALRERLDRLDTNVRAALLAWIDGGMTQEEAARAHGTTARTLYNTLQRLKRDLPEP